MTTPRKSMMTPRNSALVGALGEGPLPTEDEDEDEVVAPDPPAKKPRKTKPKPEVTASEHTVTIEAPTWAPPQREATEQLNVRIPKSLHDWVKDRHRATGEPMRSIVERGLTMLQRAEENR